MKIWQQSKDCPIIDLGNNNCFPTEGYKKSTAGDACVLVIALLQFSVAAVIVTNKTKNKKLQLLQLHFKTIGKPFICDF